MPEQPLVPEILGAQPRFDGRALQQVKTSYATAVAVQKPRSLQEAQKSLLNEAMLAGDSFYYGWTVKDDKNKVSTIEGPSVKLATAAARCWGNCAIELLPIQETGDAWVFTAVFVDLETGFTLPRQFRQSKRSKVYGKMDNERQDDIRFQIGQSKAIRNVVCNALPSWFIDKAVDKAKGGVREEIEKLVAKHGLEDMVETAFKALGKHGIKEDAILAHLGLTLKTAVQVEHLVMLRGDIQAIRDGHERATDLFPPVVTEEAKKTEDDGKTKAQQLAEAMGVEVEKPANGTTPPVATPTPVAEPMREVPTSESPPVPREPSQYELDRQAMIDAAPQPRELIEQMQTMTLQEEAAMVGRWKAEQLKPQTEAHVEEHKKKRRPRNMTPEQHDRMKELFRALELKPVDFHNIVEKYGAMSVMDFTFIQANEVISDWEGKLAAKRGQSGMFPTNAEPPPEREPGEEG